MKLQAESTREIVHIDGVPCRLWEATTEGGIACFLYVHRVCVLDGQHQEFEAELVEVPAPESEDESWC